jgi:hypothetical protein
MQKGCFAIAVSAVLMMVGLSACTASDGCPSSGARIYMSKDGSVLLQGKAVSAAELGPMLEKLKPNLTEVCYSREDPVGEPPADMPKVLDAIAALRLPVSFYTDSSFSRKIQLQ